MTDLIALFRGAIASLLPSLSAARIEWRDGKSYDPWDELSETLYRVFVIQPMEHALNDFDLGVPRYDFRWENYAAGSFIAVEPADGSAVADTLAFQGLEPNGGAFDAARCRVLDENLRPRTDALTIVALQNAKFVLDYRAPERRRISELRVPV